MEHRGALLGSNLWHQFCFRRRYRHSHGISVWHELVPVLEIRGGSHRANACHGGSVFVLSRIVFPGDFFVWRNAWRYCTLVFFPDDVHRFVAVGLLYCGYGCMDAASRGLCRWGRVVSTTKLLGALQSLGAVAIRHTMFGAVQTGCFTMSSVGAFYLLSRRQQEYGKLFVRTAVTVGVMAAICQLFPTGDPQGAMMAHQRRHAGRDGGPVSTRRARPSRSWASPTWPNNVLIIRSLIPDMLSFLTYRSWSAEVYGLDQFPQSDWPDQIPMLYFAITSWSGWERYSSRSLLAAGMLWRGALFRSSPTLWILMLSLPFPFIANTAGWITAEVGRQPWIIYGLMRTAGSITLGIRRQCLVYADWFFRYVQAPGHPVSLSGLSRN